MREMFSYLVGVLEKEERKTLLKWGIINGIGGVISLISFGITLYYINEIPGRYTLTGMLKESIEMFIAFVVFTEILFLAGSFLRLYQLKLSNQITICGAQKLSAKIYELFVKEDLEHHNQRSIAKALEMIRNDTSSCIEVITVCAGIWQGMAVLAGYIIMMTAAYRWMGLFGGVLSVLVITGLFYVSRGWIRACGERSRLYSVKTNAQISTTYGAFEEGKLSGRSDFIIKNYIDVSGEYAKAQSTFKFREGVISLLMAFSMRGMRYAIFIILIFFSNRLLSFLVPMTAYIVALDKIVPVADGIVTGMGKLNFVKNPYEELKKNLVRYQELKESEAVSEYKRKKTVTLQKGVFVKNISFAYDGKEPVLDDASIDIPVGRSVAVIGVSGVGKTTLLSLILGFYKPQSGAIYFDDYNIAAKDDSEGRTEVILGDIVSYIPQTVYMNGETVRRNVAFFEEEEKIDDAKVEACLKCAQVWEDVRKMPEGIYTVIRDRGTTISGGQRQRIALARALYRDFELLVMDEATAALDMDMEKAIMESIRQVKKNKTLLLVTHHRSLADECDMIYKIENRKIIRVK